MRYFGQTIVPGVARGALWTPGEPPRAIAGTLDDFLAARHRCLADLGALPDDLRIAYETLLVDPAWERDVSLRLSQGADLSTAILETAEQFAGELRRLDDPYLRARAADFTQLAAFLLRKLGGEAAEPPPGSILTASTISPVELYRWSARAAGVITIDVASTSHLAIVTRSLGLPALSLLGADGAALGARAGSEVLVNAFEGWVEIEPQEALLSAYPTRRISVQPDADPVSVGGRIVRVYANVNAADDALVAAQLGADGIGLVRTELICGAGGALPSFEDECASYRRIARSFAGRTIVVRVLDAGGDKPVAGLTDRGGDNGMLGLRGVRLLLREPELFMRHLQAIFEGFEAAQLRVMFPMVAIPEEFAAARALAKIAATRADRLLPELGIMLEVPAAVYALDAFALQGASFVSLGTNDLQQYFFAASRLDAQLAPLHQSTHEAWRRFLCEAVARAKDAGLDVGVCGEAAAEPRLLALWASSGVDSLSIAPALVPWLKAELRALVREPARREPLPSTSRSS